MYKLICMSFDGEYQIESPVFPTIEKAWEYSNDLGSKWFFYPFHFVITGSGKSIADSPELLERFNGKRLITVQREFNNASKLPELQDADCEKFAFHLT